MKNAFDNSMHIYELFSDCLDRYAEINYKMIGATAEKFKAAQTYWNGVFKYMDDFATPFWIALNSFSTVEKEKMLSQP